MIITGSRITYAVSSDVPALKPFAATTKTNKTPAAAVLLVSSVACIFILLGSFDRLLFFTGNVVWLFFALIVTTLFVFRKRNIRTDNQFLVPGYPILPAIFVLVCLGLSLNTWLTYPWQSACGVALAAGGIPLYFILKFLEKKFARQPNE